MPPINRTLFEKNGNFIIAKLTPQDAGTYECVAFNSVAYITAKTVLYVESKFFTLKIHVSFQNSLFEFFSKNIILSY